MILATKEGNQLKLTMAGSSNVLSSTATRPEHSSTKIHIQAISYLLRMSFTTNVYPIGGKAYKI